MKKQLLIFFTIVIALVAGTGISQKASQYIGENTIFYSGVKGTDTLKAVTPDTLEMYLRDQGFTDSLSIADSLAAFLARGYITLDSLSLAIETRTITRSDSLSEALRDTILSKNDSTGVYYQAVIADSTGAILDSLRTLRTDAKANTADQITDSLGQANVVIPNNLTIHSELTVDGTAHIDGSITTGDTFILPEGGYFESIGADTTAVVDAVFKSEGKFASMLGYYINNGFSIVPSSATETVLSGVNKFYLRSQAVINPYWSTSPTSTVIGEDAGKVGMSGADNVFVGNSAGYANTTGYYNTFSGCNSGRSNTLGYYNTFSGYASGSSNTTGYYNTFSGTYSGRFNTSGSRNTFSGYASGSSNTTGYSNTFSGYASGSSNTTGSYNLALGDSSAWNMTEGNRNVVIGSKAALRNATDSDKFIVGQGKWSGATLNQTYLIEGDFSTGVVTINNVLTLTPITTANRPATPAEGMMYMDSTVDSLKIYINSKWFNINMTEE